MEAVSDSSVGSMNWPLCLGFIAVCVLAGVPDRMHIGLIAGVGYIGMIWLMAKGMGL